MTAANQTQNPASGNLPGAGFSIQIVCFDWPWPADYGGIIDVACRIETLLSLGLNIVLHVVSYPRTVEQPAPEQYPGQLRVYRYARRGKRAFLSSLPFIVSSRAHQRLVPTLASGPPIILFDGLHCSAFMGHPRLSGHVQWLRVHNRETSYYQGLAAQASTRKQSLFFKREARLLKKYEPKTLAEADHVFPISRQDVAWAQQFAPKKVSLLTPFVPTNDAGIQAGRGEYVLFHAAFHVADNVKAAEGMVRRFAERPQYKLILAGRTPPENLEALCRANPQLELHANPSAELMHQLIRDAQVVVMDSEEKAGFKLKLLTSLAAARHVIASPAIAHGAPGLVESAVDAEALSVCKEEHEWLEAIDSAFAKTITTAQVSAREDLLQEFRAEKLARNLIEIIKHTTFTIN